MRRLMRFLTHELSIIPYQSAGLGLFSAALLVLTFPSYSVWGITFFGLVPLLLAVYRARSYREVFWAGATCSVAFILLGFNWISFVATNFGGLPWIVGKLVLIAFSIFGEIQFLLFAFAAYELLSRVGAVKGRHSEMVRGITCLLGLPVLYIGLDFLNPKIFPNTLGHVLYGWFPVAQTAEYFGVYGLTLPILVTNVAVSLLVHTVISRGERPSQSGPAARALAGVTAALVALAVTGVALFGADQWGRKRLNELRAIEKSFKKEFKVSLIQANIGDIEKLASEKGFGPAVTRVLDTFHDMTMESVERFHPDLVVWPETSFPYLYTHGEDQAANRSGAARDVWVANMLRDMKTPLFFGTYRQQGRRDYNSGFLVRPGYELGGVYRKSILLAFGEYVPLGPLAPLVMNLIPVIADFGRGKGPEVFEEKGVKFAPQICYEGIFPEHSRVGVRLGADFLLNVTNDSWFGDGTEPWLHVLLTAFRSIELRRPLVRSTNTGISTIVDLTGEMRWSTRLFEPAFLEAAVKVPGPGQSAPETFYFWHGEIFAQVCSALALLLSALLLIPHVRVSARRMASRRS